MSDTPSHLPIIDGTVVPDDLAEQTIRTVVHAFYQRIRDDELLGPVFTNRIAPACWPAHLDTMCDFWSSVLLRTGRYQGRPLPPHLQIDEISDAHFHRWLKLFRQTVVSVCPPDVAELFLGRALRIAHSFRLAVAFQRGTDTVGLAPITLESLDD